MTDTMLLDHDSAMAEHEMAGRILDDLKDGQAEETNAEAPYGFTREGTPRGKPGPKPGTRNRVRKGRPSPNRGAPKAAPRKSPAPGPDYQAGVRGILQMFAAPLAIAGMRKREFALDAATITLHADNIADGAATAAMEIPQVQAILDRLMAVGPYGALVAPVLAVGAQIMANHGLIPAGMMGTLTQEELLEAMHGVQAAA